MFLTPNLESKRSLFGCALATLFACVSVAGAQTAGRQSTSLQGEWARFETAASVDYPASGKGIAVKVPGTTFRGPENGSKALWYERDISIPADLGDRRVFIDLRGARYVPRVYIDKKLIGGGSDGWTPTVVEITAAVRAGATHRLAVRVQDRGAFFRDGFVLKEGMTNEQKRFSVLNPIGGFQNCIGISDNVYLNLVPKTFVDKEELSIVPSTRKNTLQISGKVDGAAAGAEVVGEVFDGEKVVLATKALAVGADGSFAVTLGFEGAKYWSPEDPHLYQLRLTLRNGGQASDVLTTRFGFKEVWTDGPDFYLNGVKRRLLASSTWPRSEFEDAQEIRKRVENIRAGNHNTFRLHIGPWQEAWLDAADEVGLMIICESAVYTDGDGFYAYTDPVFWDNFRKHNEGMIRRDRNRASVIMWSLGNEILFMGNKRHDPELPKKLGDLARAARAFDPTHPLTFEADLDPDGAYDVVGLHYPHEMPTQRAYPNTADWLDRRKDTEAGGGMLGQQGSTGFLWDRKKPLYVGEFLWVPQEDYSCSTIWFGDDAFLNRDKMHSSAQYRSWVDQSIGYRRAGVTGICPWTVFGFGGVREPTAEAYVLQKEAFTPRAAFWKTFGLRFFSGQSAKIQFDLFNDSTSVGNFELQLRTVGGEALKVAPVMQKLKPAEHALVTLDVALPQVETTTDIDVESVLLVDEKETHVVKRSLRVEPKRELVAPAGRRLVVLDPSGKWPNSVRSLADAGALEPEKDVLVIAQDVAPRPVKRDVPRIGMGPTDLSAARAFLLAGGPAVVLEQGNLSALGLGVSASERASTMTFALDPTHPILKGIRAEDLKYWAPDNFVSAQEISRPASGGATAVTVTGGEGWTKFAPVLELPYGRGHVVFIQALAGAKRDVEPAAARMIQNAVDYVASRPVSADVKPVRVVGADEGVSKALETLKILTTTDARGAADTALILSGGGDAVLAARADVERTLGAGGTVYWKSPTPQAFSSLADALGAPGLSVMELDSSATIYDRAQPLLRGVSRGDLIRSEPLTGWTKRLNVIPRAVSLVVTGPTSASRPVELKRAKGEDSKVSADGKSVFFDRKGTFTTNIERAAAGVFNLSMNVASTFPEKQQARLTFIVNGEEVGGFVVTADGSYDMQVPLRAGANEWTLRLRNEVISGEDRKSVTVRDVSVADAPVLPAGFMTLTVPSAVVTWNKGNGRVVVDGVTWDQKWEGPADPFRFAGALLANLGMPTIEPKASAAVEIIPLTDLKLIGESPFFTRSADQLACNSNAVFETEFDCATEGLYRAQLFARGTPCLGEYPQVYVEIDGNRVGKVTTIGRDDAPLLTDAFKVSAGRHQLRLVYDNDHFENGEDRNLVLRQVAFMRD